MSNCVVCNSVINGNRKGKIYCSNACKQHAYTARKNGESIKIDNPDTHLTFDYCEFSHIKQGLGENYEISYVEYCFIRSCSPQIKENEEIIGLMKDIIDEAYHTTQIAETAYLNGLERYRKAFFERSLATLNLE